MSPVEMIAQVHVVALPAVALGAVGVWLRQRTRPSAYLAASFGVLATTIILTRIPPTAGRSYIAVLGLSSFAWLLAAFAWSFAGPLPRALKATSLAIVGLAVWDLAASPLDTTGGAARGAFVVTFVVVWTLFAGAACAKLWRAGSDRGIVRARARAMCLGIITLNLALVFAALPENDATWRSATVALLAMASAIMFFVSFVAPPILRHWWRRGSTDVWGRMQQGLITATTPTEVAAAAAPAIAELTGGRVTIVTRHGEVLADTASDGSAARESRQHPVADDALGEQQQRIAINRSWLVIDSSALTPVFGQQEQTILEALANQLELALDRTELAQAHQDALEVARESKRDVELLLAGLAHDLRSPSVAISGYLSLLRHVDDTREREQMLDALEESSAYIGSLVDSITELATVGQGHVDVEPVDLGQIVDQVARRLAVQHPDVTVATGADLPVVLMNRSRTEQLFDNLIRNAAVHGGRDDLRVTVTSRREPDDGVTIAVTDDGVGIDGRDREHVFEMFHRGHRATGGSGLGLSIVRRIIESVGGSLRLGETTPTGGATFLVDVPAEIVISRTAADQRHASPPDRSLSE